MRIQPWRTLGGSTLLLATTAQGAFITTGVYDEQVVQSNTVDFIAPAAPGDEAKAIDTVAKLDTYKTTLTNAFAAGTGGVVTFDSFTPTDSLGTGGSINANFASGAKTLNITTSAPNGLSLATNLTNRIPISAKGEAGRAATQQGGTNGTALTMGTLTGLSGTATVEFLIGSIDGGAPLEVINSFGITVLSRAARDLGIVTAVATFTDNTTAVASRNIGAPGAALGDTFYGFIAPTNLGISKVAISYTINGENSTSFDDLAFTSTVIPEPTSLGLLGLGVFMMLRRRR